MGTQNIYKSLRVKSVFPVGQHKETGATPLERPKEEKEKKKKKKKTKKVDSLRSSKRYNLTAWISLSRSRLKGGGVFFEGKKKKKEEKKEKDKENEGKEKRWELKGGRPKECGARPALKASIVVVVS